MILEIFMLILAISILAAIIGLGMYIYTHVPTSKTVPKEVVNLAQDFLKILQEFKPYHAPPEKLTEKEMIDLEKKITEEYVDVAEAINEAYEEAISDGKHTNKSK